MQAANNDQPREPQTVGKKQPEQRGNVVECHPVHKEKADFNMRGHTQEMIGM